ncbi:VWA domain-containing protein, partial [Acidithiobacillus ferrooxidans]|nr:VWA domain-containing protein [Acidithiobacillus ferrooxidans]
MKHLEDYAELLQAFGEGSQAILQSKWQEATRVFSPSGLDQYLDGAMGLRSLGKGDGLVSSYLDAAPHIAREVGEDAVWELVGAVMKMASKTSGAVLEAVVSTSPTAANRLADPELFKSYLGMLDRLLAQVPRALRPMLENIDQLFGYLTLGGLRRWALWGAHAHRTDFEAQIAYFSLKSPEALAMLQQERKGTLFVDIQRRLRMYLRALWGRDFFLRPTSGDFEDREGYRPYIEGIFIHLPDAYDDWEDIDGMTRYRAVAVHAAAHVAYMRKAISAEALTPEQMAVIGLFEDARVEALAMRAFPGIRAIWLPFHTAVAGPVASMGHLFSRLARAIIDPDYVDDNAWVQEGRRVFMEAEARWDDPQLSWDLGVHLADRLRNQRVSYHARTDIPDILYRDDNRYIWEFEEIDWEHETTILPGAQVRKYVNVMEMVNEVDTELAGDDAQEVWVLQSELFPYEDMGLSYNQMEGKEPVSDPFHYPEWDYQIQASRPLWATVLERRPRLGDARVVREVLEKYKPVSSRLRYLI